ncbi:MAG: hypothetical protein Phog2KO_24790 [Phototrophicaceae bacterium]
MTRELWKSPWLWAIIIFSLAFTAFTRFYALDTIPFGADGDVMWMSIDAADLVLGGVIPHYVDPVYAPDPVIVYLIGLSQVLFGVSIATARIVTATTSLLTAVLMLPMMWELLHEEDTHFRIIAGVFAMLAVATSLHAMNMARLGHDSSVLTVAIALSIWTAAAAWYRGGWWRWLIAGIFLALTQYIYLTGRMMALVALAWFFYTLLANRPEFMRKWRGWVFMGVVAFILLLPNLILFVLWPSSITERVDPSATTGLVGFIWDSQWASEGRLLEFFSRKIWNIILVTGVTWETSQLPLNTPILSPLFFVGWWVGIATAIVRIRRVGYGLLLVALPTLMLADLITSPSLIPTPMRHNQILPVHYAFAGIGLAVIWQFLSQRTHKTVQIVLGISFLLAVFVPTIRGYYHYVTVYVPELYTNPINSGRVNQTDIEISDRIVAQPEQSYLLSYGDYTRKTTAWLTLAEFPERHSAVMASGDLNITNLPDEIQIVQSTYPNRARHDMGIGLEWNRWWVLLHDGQTLLLPPLTAEQAETITTAMAQAPTEDVIDSSGTVVASLYSVPLDESFFTIPDYIPVDATIGKRPDRPEVRLLGYSMYPQDPIAGEPIYLSLYWQPLLELNESYEIFAQLWDDEAQVYAESHELPYEATYRTRLWREDEITVTQHVLFADETLDVQRYSLAINFYRIVQNEPLMTMGSDIIPSQGAVLIDDFRIAPEQETVALDTLEANIQFSDFLEINQLEIQADSTALTPFGTWDLEANQVLDIALQWDVLARPPLDYSYFLHLIPTGEDQPIAQYDSALTIDNLPSGAWRLGDSWLDMSQIQVPADIASGTYDLWMGVYFYGDGVRLETRLDDALQADSRLLLGQVIIE